MTKKARLVVASCVACAASAFVQQLPKSPELLKPVRVPVEASSATRLFSSTAEEEETRDDDALLNECRGFDLNTALFCAGLAFDAYVEPPANSSRWERGSKGMNVAFVSSAFTRNLYKGIVEVTPIRCIDLPDEDDTVESVLTGGGVDAALLVASVEGQWDQDLKTLREKQYHDGVFGLSGAAHVGKSSTVWSNVNENQSNAEKKRTGKGKNYHIKSTWGKGGQAVWVDEDPFYLYLQDPATATLVFSVVDDDVMGKGSLVGSTYKRLTELIPAASLSQAQFIERAKKEAIAAMERGEQNVDEIRLPNMEWQGGLKLTSKPIKEDKNGQVAMGVAAGAMVAGPMGAAVGGLAMSFYEGRIQGNIEMRLRYLPIFPQQTPKQGESYEIVGGTPGIHWGNYYNDYLERENKVDLHLAPDDVEFCFFINHEETGGCCAVYRSLKSKLIVVSFRGTCTLKDLLTDVALQQSAWVDGEDIKNQEIPKVHSGFRRSLDSITRRLKELLLATVAPGDNISDYELLVTGHSLGGALATLFVADVAEYGIDAGRALPQLDDSDAWWKSIASTFMGKQAKESSSRKEPPRPKSLRMYNFGSPRVGNPAFAKHFDSLSGIDEAYRIVNGDDLVARNPRTINALAFGEIRYDHCGSTVLISSRNGENSLWIEGESDANACPVRDGQSLTSPLAEGTLLSDLLDATKENDMSALASKVRSRLSSVTVNDVTGVLGIDKNFSEREMKIVNSIFSGDGLSHHMEDQYFLAMCRACGTEISEEDIATEQA